MTNKHRWEIVANLMTLISFSPHYPQAQPISCWPHWPSWRWFSSSRTTSWPPDDYTDPTETHTGLHRIIEDLSTKLIRSKWFKRIFYANSFWDQEKLLEQIFSPSGACTAGGSRSGVGESVSEWVSQSVANFLCLKDQAYNCLTHLRNNSHSVYSTCVHKAQTVHTTQSGISIAVSCCQVTTGKDVLAKGSALQSLAFRRSTR